MTTNLLVNIKSSTSGSSGGSWGTVPGLSATGITVQGVGSVCLVIAQVQLDPASDNVAEFRFYINGSAAGSPIITAFSDNATNDEAQGMTLVFAVDGLSGSSNSFVCQWQTVTGSPAIDTTRPHTLQVIEIADNATIKVDQSSTGSASAPGSWANLFNATGISIAGTGSVILMLSNVPFVLAGDRNTDFQFAVGGSREGAITSQNQDASAEGSGWSGIHVLDGLSAGDYAFALQWQERVGTGAADTTRLRTFQVVEITSGATLDLDLESSASQTAPSSWGNVTGLADSASIGSASSIVLVVGNMVMAGSGSDASAQFRLTIAGTEEGAVLLSFNDWTDGPGRVLLAHAETGISGSVAFAMQWDNIAGTTVADTGRPRTLFVIEFTQVTYKLEGITKDKTGSVLGSVECYLCKDNGDNTCSFIAYVLSNASTGAYSFTGIGDNDAAYFVVGWKDDTPHVFDVGDHVLQPVAE